MKEIKTKKELAFKFIHRMRDIDPQELHDLIVQEAGEDLAAFFLSYAKQVSEAMGGEGAGSLMLMGYLIRAAEERRSTQPTALA